MTKESKKTEKEKTLKPIKAIKFDRKGVIACGKYKAGKIYIVGEDGLTNEEAHRLITNKGFVETKV